MNEAEASINEIIETFGKQHIGSDTLDTIKTSVYRCRYDDALWCLMDSLDEIMERNEPLLLLLEESWTLLCHFQERRVLNIKQSQNDALDNMGKGAYDVIGWYLEEVERVAESCERGTRSVRNKIHRGEWPPTNPKALPSMIQQRKDFKIKAE